MKYFSGFLLILSFSGNANYKQLSNEFMSENTQIRSLLGDVIKADEGIKIVESLLAPKLESEISYLDNNSDSANAVNFAAGKTSLFKLNFSKTTSWGGQFSFNNSYEKVVQDPSRIRIFGGDPEISQFKQSLSFSTSLTKNFFGQKFDLQHNASILNADFTDLMAQQTVNNLYVEFSKSYANAALAKKLNLLQKEALKRAEARLVLIRRRVNDGINLKADLYRAESAKIFQEEQLGLSEQDFKKTLFVLSSQLNRPVKIDEIGEIYNLDSHLKNFEELSVSIEKESLLILANTQYSDQKKIEKELSGRELLPDLNLVAAYQTNDYDANSSKVFDNGNLAGEKNTISVSLNLTYNLGLISEKSRMAQAEINHNQALYQLNSVVVTNQEKLKLLQQNIELSKINKEKAQKRVDLSEAIIGEYVKLFSLGRVTLDQVIQAEEDLISAQRS